MPASSFRQIIYAKEGIQISVSSQPSLESISLLAKTIYGTDGPRYLHTGPAEKAKSIAGPHFFDLWEAGKLIGTYCLSERRVNIPGGNVLSFYGRYLSVDPASGSKGRGSLLIKEAVEYIEQITQEPHLLYIYIEENNKRSRRISGKEEGTLAGQLEALLFSRVYPKKNPYVEQLPPDQLPVMREWLQEAYRQHTLVQFEHLYYQGHYFVLKEKGEIVAGVQANPVTWKIIDMPGFSGKMALHVLPYLPVIRRLVNPSRYRFLALEAIYLPSGQIEHLLTLFEGVLAHFGFTTALMMLDVHSPFAQLLNNSGKLGLMNAMKKRIFTQVMVKGNGITENQIKSHPEQPLYVSTFDCT